MENRILPAALIVAAVFPVIGPAKDKDPYEAWLDDEAQWLLTREEEKQWDKLSTPVEKDAFEALFWARRDPTPGTARNEFREEYARRLAYADGHFGTARQQGRKSDRGRVYCLLGAPTRESTYNLRSEGGSPRGASQESPGADSPSSIGGGVRGALPPILWTYESLPRGFALPNLEVRFEDYEGFGAYSLDSGGPSAAALKKAVDLAITQPDLTKAPEYAAAEPAPAAAATAQPLDVKKIATKTIVDLLSKGSAEAGSKLSVGLAVGSFVGASGEPFTPIAFEAMGGKAPADPVCFYRVSGDAGPLSEEESPAGAFRKTLMLPAGTYRLEVGVLDRATGAYGYRKQDVKVAAPPSSGLMLSSVLLGKSAETLPAAAPETEPFTFGRVKVAPSLDLSFTKADELMIFVEAYNVAEDGSGAAKLAASFAFDKNGKKWNEIPEAPQQAVRLSPGHYLLTQILPLAPFAPATYKLTVTVRDGSGAPAVQTVELKVR